MMGDETRGRQETSSVGIPTWNILNAKLKCLDFMLWQWGALDCAQIVI